MEPENDKRRLLIDHLPDGFAYHEIITDSTGTPVDYVFRDMNPAFEAMTGLKKDKIIGKKVTAVLPGIEGPGFDWIGTYGKVALTGESARFEHYSDPLGRWYEVTAYSDAPGYFATLFRDISARKHEKASLETLARMAEKYLHFPLGEMDYQVITDDLLALSGAKYVGFNTYTGDGKHIITRAHSCIAPVLRQVEDLLGFELTGKEWTVIPGRLESIKDGRLTRFDNLYDAACGAISKQVASLLQKEFALGEVYVMGIGHGGCLLGEMIFIMRKREKLQDPRLIEIYCKQAALALVRTRAEKKLQQREQQLNAVIEGQTELVCRYLPECTLTPVNEAYCRYFGKQKEELLGNDFLSFYQSVGRDISERKQSEEALLKDSEEKYRFLVDYSHDLLWMLKADGVFTYVSPSWKAILGYEPFYMIDRSFQPIVHPDDVTKCEEYMYKVIEAGKALPGPQYRVKHADGTWRWHEATCTPVFDRDGSFRYFVGVSRDITKRKQAEETLNYQLQLEQVIANISSTFVNLTAANIDEGINYTLKLTGEFFNVDRSYLFRFSDDGQTMTNTHEWCAAGIEPQMSAFQDFPLAYLPWWAAQIKEKDYVHFLDVSELPGEAEAEREEFQRQGIQSLLCVPMLKGDKVIGFFGFDAVREKKGWAPEQASFLKIIAEILVNAFARSASEQQIRVYASELELKSMEVEQLYHRLEEELDKARLVHERNFYSKLPELEGISLAAYYSPAGRMGGDYYNATRSGNKLVFYLSDVSGHSMEGAILSAFVKEAIDSYIVLKQDELDVEKIVTHLNRQFRRENYPDDYFVCIFMVVIELTTMELSYTGAGFQEAPMVLTGKGEKLRLLSEGPPISSAIPDEMMDYKVRRLTLMPGTTVLVTTDGIMEHTVDDLPYGDRLEEVFYAHGHLPPEALVQAIKEDFRSFNNGSLQGEDDITFGIIQRDPE